VAVLFAAGWVGAFDVVAAVGEEGDGGVPGGVIVGGSNGEKVFAAWFRPDSSRNRPSWEGSSMWSPFSVSAV
jgi:hypothetical protein